MTDPDKPLFLPFQDSSSIRTVLLCSLFLSLFGCQSPEAYRKEADGVALTVITGKQEEALGRSEPFTIEQPAQTLRDRLLIAQQLPASGPGSLGTDALEPIDRWPEDPYLDPEREDRPDDEPVRAPGLLTLDLNDALKVAARNNFEYQSQKENVFRSALALDLERDAFRNQFSATGEAGVDSTVSEDIRTETAEGSLNGGISRQLMNGTLLTGRIALDLTKLLTEEGTSTLGVVLDGSVEIPLLRGAGRWIVTEPLTQAERDTLYAIYNFERFKRTFAVDIASTYLGVLRQLDQVQNAGESYRRSITSSRRAQALANQGRLPETQVDQARQDEFRARNAWISAQQAYEAALDGLKLRLGLPTDAEIALQRETLRELADSVRRALPSVQVPEATDSELTEVPAADFEIELRGPSDAERGPLELDEREAILLALENRLDLRVSEGQVYDAMRSVAIAANGFLPEFTLSANASSAGTETLSGPDGSDSGIRFDRGNYSGLLRMDFGLERTAERNAYRSSLIDLERSVRSLQGLEDRIKSDVRSQLRNMLESRESLSIQAQAVALAERRVDSTNLLLKLGRAEIRDVLEAQQDLLSTQNSLTSALVNYRVAELELQSNLGLLEVDHRGLWKEFQPESPVVTIQ